MLIVATKTGLEIDSTLIDGGVDGTLLIVGDSGLLSQTDTLDPFLGRYATLDTPQAITGPKTFTSQVQVHTPDATTTGLIVKGFTGQTGDAFRTKDASDAILMGINSDGALFHTRSNQAGNQVWKLGQEHADTNLTHKYPVTFNFSTNSLSNDTLPGAPAGTYDHSFSFGFNDNIGGALVAGYPTFRDGFESKWWNGTGFQFERHVGVVYNPTTGTETRPITFTVQWADFYTTALAITCNQFAHYDNPGGVVRTLSVVNSDNHPTAPTVDWEWWYPGTGAALVQRVLALPTQTQVTLGRSSVPTTVILNGEGVSLDFQDNATSQFKFTAAHSSNALLVLTGATNPFTLYNYGSFEINGITGQPGKIALSANGAAKFGFIQCDASGHMNIGCLSAGGDIILDFQAGVLFRDASFNQVFRSSANGAITIDPATAGDVPLTLQLAGSQTGDAFKVLANGGATLAKIDAAGGLTAVAGSFTGDISMAPGHNILVNSGGVMSSSTLYLRAGGSGYSIEMADASAAAVNIAQGGGAVKLASASGSLGFYGATPVTRPTAIVDADGTLADITTKFNALMAKLRSLGLLTP